MFSTIFLVSFLSIFLSVNGNVEGLEGYVQSIAGRMMEIVDASDFDKFVKMADFDRTINVTEDDVSAIGILKFRSGMAFLTEALSVDKDSIFSNNTDTDSSVYFTFQVLGVHVIYDNVKVNLKNYTADTIFYIRFPNVRFDINILRQHDQRYANANISFAGTKVTKNDIENLNFDPENKYTQVISHQLSQSPMFGIPMDILFAKWTETFQLSLNKAVKEIDYPKLST